jgi:outer membrane receptor protein involved in Fe transport
MQEMRMANHNLKRAVRLALLAAGATSASAYVSGASAQEGTLEQVVVTGSRIATTGIESPSPLQIVGAEDIDDSGVLNLQDLLLQNPAFGSPAISRTNSNFSTSSAGVATVDLRNLGTERTLVLVNGRRFVAGIPGESAVDLNTIPQQFIERVEILTGGASSVYGSDAVAGVVNIIYKKDFEGVELEGQYGGSKESDDHQTQLGLTMGTSTADGRGNIMVHAGYTDQGAVQSRDRARSAVDSFSYGYWYYSADELFKPLTPFYSSYTPQGAFFTAGGAGVYTFTPDNQLKEGFDTNGAAGPADGFNRNAKRLIALPVERYLFATQGSYEYAEGHSVFVEGTYASSQSTTDLEPFPLDSSSIYPVDSLMPLETFYAGAMRKNPFVPQAIYDAAADETTAPDGSAAPDGRRDIAFRRRLSEIGNRGNVADRDTFRIVAGFNGDLPFGEDWKYEAFYGYGQTKEAQVSGGQVNVINFRYALEGVPDVTDLDEDNDTTEVICANPDARAEGCVPINIFGNNAISPAAAAYVNAPTLLDTFTTQKLAGLNFTGSLFDLPAGPLGIAIGAEYRDEYARTEFDPLAQAGLNGGNAIPRTEGGFDVMEEYIEVNVPILADLPFADQLSLRAAYRFSDYETVGNTDSWNVGLEWAPIPQVRFRAIRALSTRAPNINELFSPPSQTFPSGLIDPCLGVTATSTGPVAAACLAAPGVLENIETNGQFTLFQPDVQGISGRNSGNPDLGEEEGKSWTVGVVLTPDWWDWSRNLSVTIDYSKIEIDQAILLTPRQFILDQCYGGGDTSLCDFITRRPTQIGANSSGSLQFVDTQESNSGGLNAEGIDVGINYAQDLADWGLAGRFNARLAYAHAINGYEIPVPGADQDRFVGELGGAKDRFNLGLGYSIGDFAINWTTTFIGESALDDQFLKSFRDTPGCVANAAQCRDLVTLDIGVDSVTYHDVQVSWSPGDKYEVYFGVTNLFDEDPPLIPSGLPTSLLGNNTGTETDSGVYDAIGQRYYGGVRVKF